MSLIRAEEILFLISKEKKGISPSLLRDKHSIPSKNLSVMFRDLFGRGLVKRAKSPANASKLAAYYVISAKGAKYIKDHKETIRPVAQMNTEIAAAPPRYNKSKGEAPAVPLNKKANMAIEGIAQLMDDYQHANQMLKQIYKMIGDYLESNKTENTDNE